MLLKTLADMAPVVLHTVILYLFVILALGIFGKRQISEMSLTEIVIVMVIGSSVETSLVAKNTSLLAGLVSSATLLITNRLVSLATRRSSWLRKIMAGEPIVLVYEGRFVPSGMEKAGLPEDDVLRGMRSRGYDDVKRVRLAMLEIDGSISVIPKEDDAGGKGEGQEKDEDNGDPAASP